MAYLIICLVVLAREAVARPGYSQPLGSSSYMYTYQQHGPAVPVPVLHHNTFFSDPAEHAYHGYEHPVHSEHPIIAPEATAYHGPATKPVVLPSGHLADTPEVADAKAHHLGAVAQARADKYYSGHAEAGYGGAYGYSGSHNGYGIPVVLPSGHIADTHEVAAARSAHLLAVAKAKADKYYEGSEGYGYGGKYGYSGSFHGYGIPVVLPSGHIADTHEVAAAKSAHMTAVAHAKAEEALSGHYEHDDQSHYDHSDESQYGHNDESHYDHSDESHYAHNDESQYDHDGESQYDHGESHFDHNQESQYDHESHYQPEYESHEVSQIAYYEPQQLQYETQRDSRHHSYDGYH